MRRLRIPTDKHTFVMLIDKRSISLHCGKVEFTAQYPFLNDSTGYLTDVPDMYFHLMLYVLLFRNDTVTMPEHTDTPPFSLSPIVSYSGGADSTALLYVTNGIPIHITRSFNAVYESRQLRAVAEAGAYQIVTDFEQVSTLYGKRHGFSIGSGYACMYLPVLPLLRTNTIALGVIFDDVAFYYSIPFSYNDGIKHSGLYTMHTELLKYGIHITCPLAGYSEVLTTRLASYTNIKSVTSCHTEGNGPACRKCYKCFRKEALRGNPISLADPAVRKTIFNVLKKQPLKMASSAIYAIQMAKYKEYDFYRYLGIDVSFCERVNPTFLNELGGVLLPGYELQDAIDFLEINYFTTQINDPNLYNFEL